MDFAVDTDGIAGVMTFEAATDGNLANNVFLSLAIEQGTFFQNPAFGLRRRERPKNTANNEALMAEDAKQALQWIIDAGRASKIEVFTERDRTVDLHRLKLLIQVTKADGSTVTFQHFVGVA